MKKLCSKCKKIMVYDPYFDAHVCTECGNMERTEDKLIKSVANMENGAELTRNILLTFSVQ